MRPFASPLRRSSYGAPSCYDKYQAEFDKYYKLMWNTPMTPFEKDGGKRGGYEKKANEAKALQQTCGEGGTDVFSAGASAQTLWTMPYSQRKVDLSGLFSIEATIIAVAKGMQPSFVTSPLENRGVIKGGLSALYLAQLTEENPEGLVVTGANNRADDDLLIRAAGLTPTGNIDKDLPAAAEKVRREVAKHGDNLKMLAWGLRGNSILGTLKGFQMVGAAIGTGLAIAATISTVAPPAAAVLAVTAAVWSAVEGINAAVAANVAAQMNEYVRRGSEGYAAELDAKAAAAAAKKKKVSPRASSRKVSRSAQGAMPLTAPKTEIPWLLLGGGVLLLGAGYYFLRE